MSQTEIITFFQTCFIVIACLAYSFAIGKILPSGKARALFISPVLALFLLLPLRLTSICLCGATGLLFSWLATFKLALFSFGKGPLATDYPIITFPRFLALESLPIIIAHKSKDTEKEVSFGDPQMKGRVFTLKVLTFALLYKMIEFDDKLHPTFIFCIKGILVCLSIDFIIVYTFRAFVELILDLELDSPFHNPMLATSVQNFWGRRWNLAMSNILRASVYDPVRSGLTPLLGSKHAQRLGVLATFGTSGIMHEIILYYISRKLPTWGMTWYFLLQGVTVVVEIEVKRLIGQRWRLPRLVSIPMTLGFFVITCIMLIVPDIYQRNCDQWRIQRSKLGGQFFLKKHYNKIFSHNFIG